MDIAALLGGSCTTDVDELLEDMAVPTGTTASGGAGGRATTTSAAHPDGAIGGRDARADDEAASRQVWDPSTVLGAAVERSLMAASALGTTARASTHVSPAAEVARRKSLRALAAAMQSSVEERCGAAVCKRLQLHTRHTLRNGNATWERWLFRALKASGSAAATRDPLVPACDADAAEPDERLVAELVRAGSTGEAASGVATDMLAASRRIARSLSKQLSAQRGGGSVRLRWSDDDKCVLVCGKTKVSCTRRHFHKLRALYARQAGGGVDDAAFRQDLFAVLCRYDTLAGSGFQAACLPPVFDALQLHFGTQFECFASPLNCRYGRFCSAFADTDAPFGSLGSFFEFRPTEGSFQANPPFEAALIDDMRQHMEDLLGTAEHGGRALGFLVVVPVWRGNEAWEGLASSPWLRATVIVSNRDHDYTEGAQAAARKTSRAATNDTSVFVLQSAAAAKTWPATDAAQAAVRSAFLRQDPRRSGTQVVEKRGKSGSRLSTKKEGRAAVDAKQPASHKHKSKKKHRKDKRDRASGSTGKRRRVEE